MSFMEAQLTDKQLWVVVEGNYATDYIPADIIGYLPTAQNVKDYTENTEIYEITILSAYGVRLSAPGDMDCTAWEIYTNKRDAIKAYNALRREED